MISWEGCLNVTFFVGIRVGHYWVHILTNQEQWCIDLMGDALFNVTSGNNSQFSDLRWSNSVLLCANCLLLVRF